MRKMGGQNSQGPGVLAASTLVVHRLELDWDVREGLSGPRGDASAAGGVAALSDARVAAPSAPHPRRDGDQAPGVNKLLEKPRWPGATSPALPGRTTGTQERSRQGPRGPALRTVRSSPCRPRATPASAEVWGPQHGPRGPPSRPPQDEAQRRETAGGVRGPLEAPLEPTEGPPRAHTVTQPGPFGLLSLQERSHDQRRSRSRPNPALVSSRRSGAGRHN